MIPGAMMNFDLSKGFPAVTTKKLAFKACVGELLGFLRGYTNASQFEELGCNFWRQNADENKAWLENPNREGPGDLGYIYSRLWTDMPYSLLTEQWDQIEKLVQAINTDPTSRRLIVSSWHPEVFDRAALPPCHVLFQVLISQWDRKMHLTMYQRSCDMFLGVPMNIASYSLLLSLLAATTGYEPGTFTWFGADVHIYENHMDQVSLQLGRIPRELPTLMLAPRIKPGLPLKEVNPNNIALVYFEEPWPSIKAPMAV